MLVADEPVASLDASVRGEILPLLLRLRDELGLAALVVTHDLGLAWNIADRLAVMYLGRIVEVGTPEEVFASPRHPYTRALMSVLPESPVPAGGAHRGAAGRDQDPRRAAGSTRAARSLRAARRRRPGVAASCTGVALPVLPAALPSGGSMVSCHLAAALAAADGAAEPAAPPIPTRPGDRWPALRSFRPPRAGP